MNCTVVGRQDGCIAGEELIIRLEGGAPPLLPYSLRALPLCFKPGSRCLFRFSALVSVPISRTHQKANLATLPGFQEDCPLRLWLSRLGLGPIQKAVDRGHLPLRIQSA